jgi:hypothetical protein
MHEIKLDFVIIFAQVRIVSTLRDIATLEWLQLYTVLRLLHDRKCTEGLSEGRKLAVNKLSSHHGPFPSLVAGS